MTIIKFNYKESRRVEYERCHELKWRQEFLSRGLTQPKPDDGDGSPGEIDCKPYGHPLLAESVQFQGVDPNMSANTENSEHVEHNLSPENVPAKTPTQAAQMKAQLSARSAPTASMT